MAYMNDNAYDAALNYVITNGTRLHICSAEPTSAAQAISLSLGNKASITLGAVANGATSGRRTTVPAITDGVITGNGTATHWALINGATGTILAAANLLSASQVVVSGNTFTLDAFDITVPDAISA